MKIVQFLPVALCLVGLSPLGAQTIQTSLDMQQVFNSPGWQRAFAGDFAAETGVEPGVPEDPRAREVIGEIRPFIQAQNEPSTQSAIRILDAYFAELIGAGQAPDAYMLMLNGMLNYQLARTSANVNVRRRAEQQTISYFQDAIREFPSLLRAHKNLGDLYFRMENYPQAIEHFREAVRLGDREATSQGLLGYMYYLEGNLVSAENALKNALMIDPSVREFRQALGQVLQGMQRHEEAAALFGELMIEEPNNADYWNLQANAFIAQEKIDQAANNLEITRMMGVANAQSLLLLGDVYINKEMTEDATQAYLDALEEGEDVSFASSFIQAARTLNSFRSFDNAMRLLDAVREKFSDNLTEDQAITALTLRAEINLNKGLRDEAAVALEEIVARDPYNGRALISLGRYYMEARPDDALSAAEANIERSQNEQQAIIYFERVQQLDEVGEAAQGFIMEARLRVQRDELTQAVDLLEEAQNLDFKPTVEAYLSQVRAAARARSGA